MMAVRSASSESARVEVSPAWVRARISARSNSAREANRLDASPKALASMAHMEPFCVKLLTGLMAPAPKPERYPYHDNDQCPEGQ